jgi:hypothetical protein
MSTMKQDKGQLIGRKPKIPSHFLLSIWFAVPMEQASYLNKHSTL